MTFIQSRKAAGERYAAAAREFAAARLELAAHDFAAHQLVGPPVSSFDHPGEPTVIRHAEFANFPPVNLANATARRDELIRTYGGQI